MLYNYQTQIGHSPQVVADYGQRTPAFTVRLNGIDYARVYRGPHRSAAGG